MLVGFGFKVAAVPFHAWTPDVYQGVADARRSAFMASGVKAAGFAGLLRVFVVTLRPPTAERLAAGGLRARRGHLVVGSVLAVVQTDVKRMLAYRSISHAGFILRGRAGGLGRQARRRRSSTSPPTRSWSSAASAWSRSSAAAATATTTSTTTGACRRTGPVLALTFTLFLLAQAGVPFTAGFFAKFYVIGAAADEVQLARRHRHGLRGHRRAFLYLRIVVTMYFGGADDEAERCERRPARARPDPGEHRGPRARRSPCSARWCWASCPAPSPTSRDDAVAQLVAAAP